MGAIYKREMKAYFTSSIGYIFVAVFLAVSGFAFSMLTLQYTVGGQDMDLGMYFTILIFIFSIIIPLLTMKSFSEERKMKTEQLLLTSPVSLAGMIVAKFLAAYTIFVGSYLASCSYYFVLFRYQPDALVLPNLSVTLLGYSIAIILLGGAFIAAGIFISSLTENQIVAVMGTLVVLMFFLLCSFLNNYINVYAIRAVLSWLSIYSRFVNFTYGYFDFAAVAYYASIMFIFLFLTVRVYEKRRWE